MYEAVQETITRMLFAIDRLQWDALRTYFAHRVQIDYTSLFGGEPETLDVDELLARWRALLPGFDATQHMTGPIVVTRMRDDEALAETHVRGYHYIGTPQEQTWLVAGHYTMRLVQERARWCISSIRLDVYRQEGNTALAQLALERAKTSRRR
jgi:hypothetical protein